MIEDADQFFEDLATKVSLQAELREAPPLTTALATAELKRYLPDPVQRIRLHDLMTNETTRTAEAIGLAQFPTPGNAITRDDVELRLEQYDAQMERLIALLATGVRFADRAEHDDIWMRSVLALDRRPRSNGGNNALIDLQNYPTMLAVFALGLAGIVAGDLSAFLRVVRSAKARWSGADETILEIATPPGAFGHAAAVIPTGPGLPLTPFSDLVHEVMRRQLGSMFVNEEKFEEAFDQVEFLLAVLRTGLIGYLYLGRFWPKYFRSRTPLTNQGPSLEPFRSQLVAPGLFETDEDLNAAVEHVQSAAREAR